MTALVVFVDDISVHVRRKPLGANAKQLYVAECDERPVTPPDARTALTQESARCK